MSPYRRSALFLIRIVAITLIFAGASLLYLDFAERKIARIKPPPRPAAPQGTVRRIATLALPWVLLFTGVPLLVRSSVLARRLTEDLEDDTCDSAIDGTEEEPPSQT